MADKYEVEFKLTFDKVKESGVVEPEMVATIKYLSMDYANAVKAEACMKPAIEALFALGQENKSVKSV